MKTFIAPVALALLLPASAAIAATCTADIEKVTTRYGEVEQSLLKADAGHPLVVPLSDGRLVDLRGEEPRSAPLESWFTDEEMGKKAVTHQIATAQEASEAGKADACAQAVTAAFDILSSYEVQKAEEPARAPDGTSQQ